MLLAYLMVHSTNCPWPHFSPFLYLYLTRTSFNTHWMLLFPGKRLLPSVDMISYRGLQGGSAVKKMCCSCRRDPSSVPSTYTRWLPAACNSSCRESSAAFRRPPVAPTPNCVHAHTTGTHMCTHIHAQLNIK